MNKAMAIPTNPARAGTAIAVAELPVCCAWPPEPVELDPPEPDPLAEESLGVVGVPSVDGVVVEPAVPLLTAAPPDGAVDFSTDFAPAW